MATRTRTQLAAVLGAAVITAATAADAAPQGPSAGVQPTTQAAPTPVTPAADTLGDVIESKLRHAAGAMRHTEIEQLGTLWMTLKQRSQLDRQVSSGERFIAAALRNQRMSAYRQAARAGRAVPVSEPSLDGLADQYGSLWQTPVGARAPDERLAATDLIGQLEEPYRTAVILSAEGLNRREVAERMGVSHAAVRKWMQRLRERLEPQLMTPSLD